MHNPRGQIRASLSCHLIQGSGLRKPIHLTFTPKGALLFPRAFLSPVGFPIFVSLEIANVLQNRPISSLNVGRGWEGGGGCGKAPLRTHARSHIQAAPSLLSHSHPLTTCASRASSAQTGLACLLNTTAACFPTVLAENA